MVYLFTISDSWNREFLHLPVSSFIDIYLFERVMRGERWEAMERETEREGESMRGRERERDWDLLSAGLLTKSYNNPDWPGLAKSKNCRLVGPKYLSHPCLLSSGTQSLLAALDVQHLGFKSVLIWDALQATLQLQSLMNNILLSGCSVYYKQHDPVWVWIQVLNFLGKNPREWLPRESFGKNALVLWEESKGLQSGWTIL